MGYIPPGIKPCLTQIKRVTICSAVLCAGWLCVWTSSAFLSSPPSPSSSSSCTAAFLLPTPVWPSPTPYRCAALTCCIWVGKIVGQDRYCAVINLHCLLLHSCYSLLVFFPFPHPANRPVSVHREAAFWNRSPFYISGADQSLHKGRSSCDTCVLVVSMANRKNGPFVIQLRQLTKDTGSLLCTGGWAQRSARCIVILLHPAQHVWHAFIARQNIIAYDTACFRRLLSKQSSTAVLAAAQVAESILQWLMKPIMVSLSSEAQSIQLILQCKSNLLWLSNCEY